MAASGSLRVILGSFAANLGIALAKTVAAVLTGSGAMLAEAIHSAADCINQVLLLIGAKQAEKPPDTEHPLGYGRSAYFWSFLVALMIFFGGGILSIREGIHKANSPEPIAHVWIGIIVLVSALFLETLSAIQAKREIDKRRGNMSFWRYLKATTDADLIILFAEDAAAVLGLLIALGSLGLAIVTGDPSYDGVGSLVIGVLLTIVAAFLGREVKSLLDGERADPRIEQIFREEALADARIGQVLRVITLQQGPSQVLLAAKLYVQKGLVSQEVAEAFNRLEERVKRRCPEVKWQFLEPDLKE